MAMKMINSTRRMSIIGVTLMSEESPPPLPVENAMRDSSILQIPANRPGTLVLHTAGGPSIRLLRQHAKRIGTRGTNIVDGFHHHPIVRPRVRPQIDLFVRLVLQHVGDL